MNPAAQLDQDALARLALYALGFAVGLLVAAAAFELFEHWVIAGDLADRERVRWIVREELARIAPQARFSRNS